PWPQEPNTGADCTAKSTGDPGANGQRRRALMAASFCYQFGHLKAEFNKVPLTLGQSRCRTAWLESQRLYLRCTLYFLKPEAPFPLPASNARAISMALSSLRTVGIPFVPWNPCGRADFESAPE